ncbi:MAG: OmpA family protein, partial [Bacteroidota bacterium]
MQRLIVALPIILAGCGGSGPLTESGEIAYLAEKNEQLQREISRLSDENEAARASLIEADQALAEARAQVSETVPIVEPASVAPANDLELIVVLSTDEFFVPGTAKLNPAGIERMRAVASQLKQDYTGRTFRIEGYTDNTLSAQQRDLYPSNWELSAGRAGMLARHL